MTTEAPLLELRGLKKHYPVMGGLLRQVEAFDRDALLLEPVDVGGEAGELGVDARAADAGGAAHGGVEHTERHGHGRFLSIIGDER